MALEDSRSENKFVDHAGADPNSHGHAGIRRRRVLEPAKSVNFEGAFSSAPNHTEVCRPGKWNSIRDYTLYSINEFQDPNLWRAAFIELVGTIGLTYLSTFTFVTIESFQSKYGPIFGGIANLFTLSLFIWATGSASGGHVNPMLTIATLFCGLTSLSRAFLYMLAQLTGAAISGGLVRGSLGPSITDIYRRGGCYIGKAEASVGQIFLIETVFSLTLLFLAIGTGLDPRQKMLFGPIVGPLMVGSSLGLLSFASGGVIDGFAGASMNPARCFAYSVAAGDFEDHWIWWAGPFTAAVLIGVVYAVAPPHFVIVVSPSDVGDDTHEQ